MDGYSVNHWLLVDSIGISVDDNGFRTMGGFCVDGHGFWVDGDCPCVDCNGFSVDGNGLSVDGVGFRIKGGCQY